MASRVHLRSRLPEITAEIPGRVKLATEMAAKLIAEEAKSRVPVRTGALRNAIHVEYEGDADWSVVAGDTQAFYGHMVEYGTTRAPAQPFLVPAAEARRRELDRLIRSALSHL